jgi:hypothetical protein
MEEIKITEISVLGSGEIRVTPIINWNDFFQFIYRTATGVVWCESSKSFMSPVPRDWSLFDWYKNIVGSVISEMGVLLTITSDTQWHNVPIELQQKIESYVPEFNT